MGAREYCHSDVKKTSEWRLRGFDLSPLCADCGKRASISVTCALPLRRMFLCAKADLRAPADTKTGGHRELICWPF